MVAIEVAIAILTASSESTPRPAKMTETKGTMTIPPPRPSKPAKKPVAVPKAASSMMSGNSRSIELRFGTGLHPETSGYFCRL